MPVIRRFREPLSAARLLRTLAGDVPPSERVPSELPLEPLQEAIDSMSSALSGSAIDAALIEPVHRALRDLTHGEAADMRIWHWLCAVAVPNLVWRRWRNEGTPSSFELETALTDSVSRRFLGTSSMVGVARNTLARLWWTAEHLDGDYDLARMALSRQDAFQAIFDRLFGLHPPAARAAIRRFQDRTEEEVRVAARWLNYAGSTAALEALSEEEIGSILDESLPPLRGADA